LTAFHLRAIENPSLRVDQRNPLTVGIEALGKMARFGDATLQGDVTAHIIEGRLSYLIWGRGDNTRETPKKPTLVGCRVPLPPWAHAADLGTCLGLPEGLV
jgi:hypothetical protein